MLEFNAHFPILELYIYIENMSVWIWFTPIKCVLINPDPYILLFTPSVTVRSPFYAKNKHTPSISGILVQWKFKTMCTEIHEPTNYLVCLGEVFAGYVLLKSTTKAPIFPFVLSPDLDHTRVYWEPFNILTLIF